MKKKRSEANRINLQKLMLKSRSNKLLAIRRITQINRGRRSPGIDKIVVNTDKERNLLMEKLANNNLSSVKRRQH